MAQANRPAPNHHIHRLAPMGPRRSKMKAFGINPGMGWPLAVAAGLTERDGRAVARTLAPLAVGHLLSITAVLLPFAALALVLDWSREIRIAAGIGIIAFAGLLLVYSRHPRWMSRIRPRQVALWSFAVALLHGAGLMLVPMLLGLCGPTSAFGSPDLLGNTGLVVAIAAALRQRPKAETNG